jgi:PhoPQ-activated pathogenicity-related protein
LIESKSIWWHYLVIIVPENCKSKTNATLWIGDGGMSRTPPDLKNYNVEIAAALAVSTGIITGALFQIPNESTTFADDPSQESRSEDAIIAYCWDHFLKDPSQPEWLVRFPMIKASVRAMDTITDFISTKFPSDNYQLDSYAVIGASKRGWTTWLVGAVDSKRVKLIVPIVLDAVNFIQVEHHQYRSYGGWSWALEDYTNMNIMSRLDDPNMHLLSEYEDPYYYFSRLTMPKLIINAGMDEFQQPDDTHYWWKSLPQPKHFIMTPNAEHSEITGIFEILPAMITWLNHQLLELPVPTFAWTIDSDSGEIVVTLDEQGLVYEANLWYAYSCGVNSEDGLFRRDYRIASLDNPCSCGIYDESEGGCLNLKSFWTKQTLNSTMVRGHRTYRAQLDAPTDGRYVAYFIDVKYRRDAKDEPTAEDATPSSADQQVPWYKRKERQYFLPKDLAFRLEFTSEVSVWPNTFPYADCQGEACKGHLL